MALSIRELAKPNADQLNADDLRGRELVGKITRVREGSAEQRLIVHIDSWPQPWKPCKTMMTLLAEAWHLDDPEQWVGRSVRLYRDASVKFDKNEGGIRVSEVSHITSPFSAFLRSSRGKRKRWTVSPLKTAPEATLSSICADAGVTREQLDAWHRSRWNGNPAPADGTDHAKQLAAHLPAMLGELCRFSEQALGNTGSKGGEE